MNNVNEPEIILDECIFSQKLFKLLRKLGFRAKFLGRRVPDNYIRLYVQSHNAVLVTEDRELQASLGWKKALFLESWNNLKDMIAIIKAWLDK